MAQNEPPHQDLPCLQIQLYVSLVVKELVMFTGQTASVMLVYTWAATKCKGAVLQIRRGRSDDLGVNDPYTTLACSRKYRIFSATRRGFSLYNDYK